MLSPLCGSPARKENIRQWYFSKNGVSLAAGFFWLFSFFVPSLILTPFGRNSSGVVFFLNKQEPWRDLTPTFSYHFVPFLVYLWKSCHLSGARSSIFSSPSSCFPPTQISWYRSGWVTWVHSGRPECRFPDSSMQFLGCNWQGCACVQCLFQPWTPILLSEHSSPVSLFR